MRSCALLLLAVLGAFAWLLPHRAQAQSTTNAPAPASQPASSQVEEDAIRSMLKAQVSDWNRGDVRAFMGGYWNSPQTELVGSTGIIRGWKSALETYRKQYPDRAAMGRLNFSDLEINMLAPDAALVVGRWHLKRQSDAPGGVFTLVFRKFSEGWRIVNDHTSEITPP